MFFGRPCSLTASAPAPRGLKALSTGRRAVGLARRMPVKALRWAPLHHAPRLVTHESSRRNVRLGAADPKGIPATRLAPAQAKTAPPVADAAYKFLTLGVVLTAGAYAAHPKILELVTALREQFNLGALTGQDAWFLSFLSLVFSLLAGATFEFQYGRQQMIISSLYDEIFALEGLWNRAKVQLPEALDEVAANLREYIEDEIYMTDRNVSPFYEGSPLLGLSMLLGKCQKKGKDVEGLLNMVETLSDAQNKRAAASVKILPPMHWVILWALVFASLVSTLVFEPSAAGDVMNGQRTVFAMLAGLASSIVLIIQDLTKPVEGSYSLLGSIKQRMDYLAQELRSH
ncbi:unnamed protein product [Ostreobium quekettii]|uniref:Uncharacterized protein n=1 Tax=Ostreobium quekettii TaxID=121088 RepID=A0A8S1J509_9CHLO|nr:unnamed protein product [Ostreobium quekettii]|eukprot:evm.model.scf_215EXC.8 EVM.evm.TU.scf_215EXC.8   scf_215EXC:98409-103084(+)